MMTDLHGHSMKKKSFFYGCSYLKTVENATNASSLWTQVQLLPRILANRNPTFFAIEDCRFKITEDRL